MHANTELTLTRDCEAIQIPSGNKLTLPAGTTVFVTQSLGGSYTVATESGLARISEENADALGFEKPAGASDGAGQSAAVDAEAELNGGTVDEKAVWDKLRTCYDPEIPVNIVDLGLVYDCTVTQGDAGGASVEVKMTLTAPGCGMGPAIASEARSKIESLPGVAEANVELVWDPPWNQAMISEIGKMQLGLI